MCIAIACIGDAHPPRVELNACCVANSHGFGYAFVTEDSTGVRVLTQFKSMDADEVVEKYLMAFIDFTLEDVNVLASVFHARISTHGEKTVENCHPFQIGDDTQSVLIHNGILPVRIDKDDDRSDTHVFAAEVLPLMGGIAALEHAHLWDMLENYIGGSKVVILSARMRQVLAILGEKKGHWNATNDVWYSNYSYRKNQWQANDTTERWRGSSHYDTASRTSTTLHSDKCVCTGCLAQRAQASKAIALPGSKVTTTTGNKLSRRERRRRNQATYSQHRTFEQALNDLNWDDEDETLAECDYCQGVNVLQAPDFAWCKACGSCQLCGVVREAYDELCPCEDESDDAKPVHVTPLSAYSDAELSDWALEVMDFLAAFPGDDEGNEMRRELDVELARRAGDEVDAESEPETPPTEITYLAKDDETGLLVSMNRDEFNARNSRRAVTNSVEL